MWSHRRPYKIYFHLCLFWSPSLVESDMAPKKQLDVSTVPKRPPNKFLLLRAIIGIIDRRVGGDVDARWIPDPHYIYPFCYDHNEWLARPENGDIIATLTQQLRDTVYGGADAPFAGFNLRVQANLSTYAAAVWDQMSGADQERLAGYQVECEMEHQRLHPDYVYSPERTATKRKRGNDAKEKREGEGLGERAPKRSKSAKQAITPSSATTVDKPATRVYKKRKPKTVTCYPQLASSSASSAASKSSLRASTSACLATQTTSPPISPPARQFLHIAPHPSAPSYTTYGSNLAHPSDSNNGYIDSTSQLVNLDTLYQPSWDASVLYTTHSYTDVDGKSMPAHAQQWAYDDSDASSLGGSPQGIVASSQLPHNAPTSPGSFSAGYDAYTSYTNVAGPSNMNRAQVPQSATDFVDQMLGSTSPPFMAQSPSFSTGHTSSPNLLSPLDATLGLGPSDLGAIIDVFDMSAYDFGASTVTAGMNLGMNATAPGFDGFEVGALDYDHEANGFGFDLGALAPDYDPGVYGNSGAHLAASAHGLDMTDLAFGANAPTANFDA
ncbi:hypothetical protein PENSPDRAFT_468070 [Peniophora sp. CONT]|nr:hypothetical protein PENSPDRAFT_468070 [Peniophora sp. CONT]